MVDYRIRPVHTCHICCVIFGSYCKQWDKPICFICRVHEKDPDWVRRRYKERRIL